MSRRSSVTVSILDDRDRFIADRKRGHPAPPYTGRRRADTMPHHTLPRRVTYDDYRVFLHDGKRYEVLDGEVHMAPVPSPHHQFTNVSSSASSNATSVTPRITWR